MSHLTGSELEAGLPHIREAPVDHGTVKLIVQRPDVEEREVVDEVELDPEVGVVGDNWRVRGSSSTADGSAHPEKQVTVMNARVAGLLAGDPERRPLAGDQLYVDLDVSIDNLPPGTRLRIGGAEIEVSEPPHTGCAKFSRRFGVDALRFVNSPEGKRLRLRGLNARVVEGGTVRTGDPVSKL